MFHLVQPWGDDKYSQATIVSTHETVEEACAELDRIAEKLQHYDAVEETLEIYAVDERRQRYRGQGCSSRVISVQKGEFCQPITG